MRKVGQRKYFGYGLLISCITMVLLLMSGCGQKEGKLFETFGQEEKVYYYADKGEYIEWFEVTKNSEDKKEPAKGEKTVIRLEVLKSEDYHKLAERFNIQSEKYRVEIGECVTGEPLGEKRKQLNKEVPAGGGPDIIMEDLFKVSREDLEKGLFVDLAPYLQEWGISEENYFPAYANLKLDDKIYGVTYSGGVSGWAVKKEVLGCDEMPDVETFADKLLAYPKKAGFWNPDFDQNCGGIRIMKVMLDGSENLWGMIDWENRKCDFSKPLFSKILDVAKRYSADGANGYEPIMTSCSGWIVYCDWDEDSDKVYFGEFFDDGCFPKRITQNTLLINANSKNIEGALEFIKYVLSEKEQSNVLDSVIRKAYEKRGKGIIRLVEEGRTNVVMDEEKLEKLIEMNNTAQFFPMRPDNILRIVYEEAPSYISGEKSKAEVIDIIQSRVQLYLDEL